MNGEQLIEKIILLFAEQPALAPPPPVTSDAPPPPVTAAETPPEAVTAAETPPGMEAAVLRVYFSLLVFFVRYHHILMYVLKDSWFSL